MLRCISNYYDMYGDALQLRWYKNDKVLPDTPGIYIRSPHDRAVILTPDKVKALMNDLNRFLEYHGLRDDLDILSLSDRILELEKENKFLKQERDTWLSVARFQRKFAYKLEHGYFRLKDDINKILKDSRE